MGRRGPVPASPENKVIAGNFRADRDALPENAPQFDILTDFPLAPQRLDVIGVEMWAKLGPQLVRASVLQTVDLYMLEVTCYAWQKFAAKMQGNLDVTAAEVATLRAMFSEFGMSPAARRRVMTNATPTPKNKFTSNGKREESA